MIDLVEKVMSAIMEAGTDLEFTGDILLVQRLPKRELSAGKIIMVSGDRQMTAFDADVPEFVKVLAVGPGFYNEETLEDVPLEISPGYVLEVAKSSVRWFSSFGVIIDNPQKGVGVGLMRESERRLTFKTEKAYHTFMNHFNDPELIK